MPWLLAILAAIAGAIAFANLIYRSPTTRDRVAWAMAFSLAVFGQGVMVGWKVRPVREATQPIATERNEAKPNATERIATLPDGTERLARDRDRTERYQAVLNEIGPPPVPNAVPVLGYVTASGVEYPARWRTKPNNSDDDNFK